jgi:hypothetical protein
MLCISTHVQIPTSHPEFAGALCGLLHRLRRLKLDGGSDPVQAHGAAHWLYCFSMPCRAEDGSIGYLHVFHHPEHPVTGEPLTLTISASDGWWPDAACRSLSPARSDRRTHLKLVS